MVFWMKRASRTIKGDLTHKMEAAPSKLGASGVFLAALLAVGREGLETALFCTRRLLKARESARRWAPCWASQPLWASVSCSTGVR